MTFAERLIAAGMFLESLDREPNITRLNTIRHMVWLDDSEEAKRYADSLTAKIKAALRG